MIVVSRYTFPCVSIWTENTLLQHDTRTQAASRYPRPRSSTFTIAAIVFKGDDLEFVIGGKSVQKPIRKSLEEIAMHTEGR
jgi:hypothetical protein